LRAPGARKPVDPSLHTVAAVETSLMLQYAAQATASAAAAASAGATEQVRDHQGSFFNNALEAGPINGISVKH
jgi:hypothetical protein